MKAAEENQAQVSENTIIKAAAADCDAATARLVIDPREIVIAWRARIAELKFPTIEKEIEAARCVRMCSPRIDELIRAAAPLSKIYAELERMKETCEGLTAPVRIPSFQDQMHSAMREFLRLSWAAEEAEALRSFAKHSDRLRNITISSVTIGDREITRTQVREEMRKNGWSNAMLFQYERNEQRALANERAEKQLREQGGIKRLTFSDGAMNQKAIQQ
jgi:hypothetical protein